MQLCRAPQDLHAMKISPILSKTGRRLLSPILSVERLGIAKGLWFYLRVKFFRSRLVDLRIATLPHPLYLRPRSSDFQAFGQIFLADEYGWNVNMHPKVIVDAGANIGLSTVLFANKYPDARIIALEPEMSNFLVLKRNVANYANVNPLQMALWHCTGNVAVRDTGRGHWGFQVDDVEGAVKETRMQAQAVSLPDLLARFEVDYVDLLKIDIEGGEKRIFENAGAWVNKIGAIVIELHDHLVPGCSRAFYRATVDFEKELHIGENVMVMR